MGLVRLSPQLSCPLAPCCVNNDFARLCSSWDNLEHYTCTSQGTHLATGSFVWYACYELHHESPGCCCIRATLAGPMVMLYEILLWLRSGYVMAAAMAASPLPASSARREAVLRLPCQPGGNKRVCSAYCSLSLCPASDFPHCLPWVQQAGWTARQLASQIGSATPRNILSLPYMNFYLWITDIYSSLTISFWWLGW